MTIDLDMHNNACFCARPARNAKICILLHIITLTKQDAMPHTDATPEQADLPAGVGAPDITVHLSADSPPGKNFLLRSAPRGDGALPFLQPSPGQVPTVTVWVSGVRLELPEPLLHEGLSLFRLSTGAHVRVEDYAKAVASVLEALERGSRILVLPAD